MALAFPKKKKKTSEAVSNVAKVNGLFKKNKKANRLIVVVDAKETTIHFYYVTNGKDSGVRHETESYRNRTFNEDFFERFKAILRTRSGAPQNKNFKKVSLVLPDYLFLYDSIRVPAVNTAVMRSSLLSSMNNLYKNYDEIKFNIYQASKNRQFATFMISGIRESILNDFKSAFSENGYAIENVTSFTNAVVSGTRLISSNVKSDSYLLMDVKEGSTYFAFVAKDRMIGSYSLPFGYDELKGTRVVAEENLFDHATADLLILNAQEKAKAKQLTVIDDNEAANSEEGGENDNPFNSQNSASSVRKNARKLPKALVRPVPTGRENFIYENFRVFQRWALNLIANNPSLTGIAKPEAVYVNMPLEYSFLYEMVNAEAEENGVMFQPIGIHELDEEPSRNAELFGGIFFDQFKESNNF